MDELLSRQKSTLLKLQSAASDFKAEKTSLSVFLDCLGHRNSQDDVLKSSALTDICSEALILQRDLSGKMEEKCVEQARDLAAYILGLSEKDLFD